MQMCLCVRALVPPFFLPFCASRLAFGNCNGLAVVDYLQKTILLCMSTLDMYGAADPYQRLTRSPRRNRQSTSGNTHTHTHFLNTATIRPHKTVTMQPPHRAYSHCHLISLLLSSTSSLLPLLSSVCCPRLSGLSSQIGLISLVGRTCCIFFFYGIICDVVHDLINSSAGLIWSKPLSLDQPVLIKLMAPSHIHDI